MPEPSNLVTFGENVMVGEEKDGSVPLVTPRGTEWVQPQNKLPSLPRESEVVPTGGLGDTITAAPTLEEVAAQGGSQAERLLPTKNSDFGRPGPPPGPPPGMQGINPLVIAGREGSQMREDMMSPLSPSAA